MEHFIKNTFSVVYLDINFKSKYIGICQIYFNIEIVYVIGSLIQKRKIEGFPNLLLDGIMGTHTPIVEHIQKP
jgi:hypothetical protein